MRGSQRPIRGRGTRANPPGRFERILYEADPEWRDPDDPAPRTEFLKDRSRSVLTRNDSPDVGFDVSLNPYRGCEHGCAYCYARPTHEYLGLSAGLDFETRILVKEDAPELLRRELSARSWRPEVIALSGVTDPYQPIERHLRVTRRCLDVLVQFRNPVTVVTKNRLVERDIDLLGELARLDACSVHVSLTTLRTELYRVLEPRTSHPRGRLEAIEKLAKAGIPAGVMVAPVIPGLNDREIPKLLEEAARAGARFASTILLRLPRGVATLFESWLDDHFPERKAKVLGRIRDSRAGALTDARFGSRMRGKGPFARQIADLFAVAARRVGLEKRPPQLRTDHFRRPGPRQLTFFD